MQSHLAGADALPTTSSKKSTPSHFASLDSLRGIAALCVAIYHINWFSPLETIGVIQNGYLMVDLFFVLSGFVVFYAYGSRVNSWANFARFIWQRFWRLYPLHFVFLIVFLILEFVKAAAQIWLPEHTPAFTLNNLSSFVSNLLLVQTLHITQLATLETREANTYNYVAWSISAEFYVCVLFGLMLVLFRRKAYLTVASALLAALGMFTLIKAGARLDFSGNTYAIGRCLTGFFEGAVIFSVFSSIRSATFFSTRSNAVVYFATASFVVFFTFLSLDTAGYSSYYSLLVYPLAGILVLSLALAPARGPVSILHNPKVLRLGVISYSVYMTHPTIIWIVGQAVHFGAKTTEVYLPPRLGLILMPPPLVGDLATIIVLVSVIALSNFTFDHIENPFRRWSKTKVHFD